MIGFLFLGLGWEFRSNWFFHCFLKGGRGGIEGSRYQSYRKFYLENIRKEKDITNRARISALYVLSVYICM